MCLVLASGLVVQCFPLAASAVTQADIDALKAQRDAIKAQRQEKQAVVEQLEAEKGIPKEYMIEKIEAALVSAYKREQGGNSNVRVFIDPLKKEVRVFQLREVVDDDFEEYNEINVEIQYDGDDEWHHLAEITPTKGKSRSVWYCYPMAGKRLENFKIRVSGMGKAVIYGIVLEFEKGAK